MSATLHAKYAASASHRWLACPGSIALSAKAPPGRESHYAKEGTDAHLCFEAFLKNHIEGKKWPQAVEKELKKKYPSEMVEHAMNAAKWVTKQMTNGEILLSETKVELPRVGFGTVDAAIIEKADTLTVVDFKYGAGVVVNPENNSQLIYYALALAKKYNNDFDTVRLVIIQPRAYGEDMVKEWIVSMNEIADWEKTFVDGVRACQEAERNPEKYLVPGDEQCRFCPAAVICPELGRKSLKEVQADFDDETGALALPTVATNRLDITKNLGKMLTACNRLETWIEKLREHALNAMQSGEKVEGWKLVQKRSIRRYISPEAAAKAAKKLFGKKAFTEPELLSPAQLEKVIKTKLDSEKFLRKYVTAESSGVTIAAASDPRPEYDIGEEFRLEGKEEK